MLTLNPRLALCVLLPYPLFILFARAIGRRVHHWSLLTQEGLGEASNQLQEAISGIAVVKAYAMEGVTAASLPGDQRRRCGSARSRWCAPTRRCPASPRCCPAFAMCLILYVGGSDIVAGRMAVADFFTFAIYVFQLTFPTFIMGWVVALVQRGAASMQRIDELLSAVPSIAEPRGSRAGRRAARRDRVPPSHLPLRRRRLRASPRCATSRCACPPARRSASSAPWAPARARWPR